MLDLITFLFYASGMIILAYEFVIATNSEEMVKYNKRSEDRADSKILNDNDRLYILFMVFYMLWTFIGLFTFQWWAFLFLLGISVSPLKKTRIGYQIDSTTSLIIVLFIILNKMHFHIHLFK